MAQALVRCVESESKVLAVLDISRYWTQVQLQRGATIIADHTKEMITLIRGVEILRGDLGLVLHPGDFGSDI
jgi:hypothetical protein